MGSSDPPSGPQRPAKTTRRAPRPRSGHLNVYTLHPLQGRPLVPSGIYLRERVSDRTRVWTKRSDRAPPADRCANETRHRGAWAAHRFQVPPAPAGSKQSVESRPERSALLRPCGETESPRAYHPEALRPASDAPVIRREARARARARDGCFIHSPPPLRLRRRPGRRRLPPGDTLDFSGPRSTVLLRSTPSQGGRGRAPPRAPARRRERVHGARRPPFPGAGPLVDAARLPG